MHLECNPEKEALILTISISISI